MRRGAPALIPGLVLICAVVVAREVGRPGAVSSLVRALPVVVLLLVCWALPRDLRILPLAAALGWFLGWRDPVSDDVFRSFDPTRPVEVQGRLTSPWAPSGAGWRARLRVAAIEQGEQRVGRAPLLSLYLVGEESPPTGGLLTTRGYLRAPIALLNGNTGRDGRWHMTIGSRRLLRSEAEGTFDGLGSFVATTRSWVDHRLDRRAGRAAGLVRALLLGDTSRLQARRLAALRRLGLGHLVAVSGLHLGLLTSLVWMVSGALGVRMRLALAALAVVTYLVLVGPRPSLLRSSLMAATALVSLMAERRPNALNCWTLAVAGMVMLDPALVSEVSFQLTAVATFGLIVMTPSLGRRWGPVFGRLPATAIAASVSAHIATLPWAVGIFHLWSPASILLNLVAIPWTALTLAMGGLGVLLEPCPGLGDLLWSLLGALAAPLDWLARLPAGPPWSFAVHRDLWTVAGLSVLLALALCRASVRLSVAMVLAVPVVLLPLAGPSRGLELAVLDVGQGEAILLRDGDRSLLVDGGGWRRPGVGQRVLLPALLELGVRRLTGILLTHPDGDHCRGLLELAGLIRVERVWSAPAWSDDCYRELIASPGLELSPLWRDRRLTVGRWRLRVLHPAAGDRSGGNDRSLVVAATAGEWTLLLTGDVGSRVERRLVDEQAEALPAAILKIGHHGSRSSTGAPFLSLVAPRLALISAGRKNVYGHPSAAVLERLERGGVAVWRTDRGGQIRLRFDGARLTVWQPWSGVDAAPVSYNLEDDIARRYRRSDRDR